MKASHSLQIQNETEMLNVDIYICIYLSFHTPSKAGMPLIRRGFTGIQGEILIEKTDYMED